MGILLFVAGDEVERVALDVGERGPPGTAAVEFIDRGGTECVWAFGVGLVVGRDQVPGGTGP